MSLAPIALFVYNRPVHTLQVLEALASNESAAKSELFIFSDGPKADATSDALETIRAVRQVIRQKKWCEKVSIIEQDHNLGIAQSIIAGVSRVLKTYEKVIVLEDDIVPAPVFLSFMNEALSLYEMNENVLSISSLNFFALSDRIPDIFFCQLIDCWGWATWRRGWDLFEPDSNKLLAEIDRRNLREKFNVNGAYDYYGLLQRTNQNEIDAWDIRWYASGLLHNKLSLYPKVSLTVNIGFDGSGVNSGHQVYSDGRQAPPQYYPTLTGRKIENNEAALAEFHDYFHSRQKSLFKKGLEKLSGLIKSLS